MKHLFTVSLRRFFQKQLIAMIALVSIVSLSVPPAVFAQTLPADAGSAPTEQAAPDAAPTDAPAAVDTADTTDAPPADTAQAPADPASDITPPADTDAAAPADTATDTDQTAQVPADTSGDVSDSSTTPAGDTSRTLADETDQQAPAAECTLVSDTTTATDGHASILATVNAAWTAVLNGASWIWGESPMPDTQNQTFETFTKTFSLTNAATSASITIAADNSFVAKINGTEFASESDEVNYTDAGQRTIDIPAADLQPGENTLEITVTNFAMSGGTMDTNPAGLLYTLTIDGSDCTTTPPPPAQPMATIVATKVMCDSEADLPNWGAGGHAIDADTAADFVAASGGKCHLESGWNFQWGDQNAADAGDTLVGPASGYTTFSNPTDAHGVTTQQVPLDDLSEIHLREELQAGDVPFSHAAAPDNSNDVSAEFYCTGDALNYDNWDFIRGPQDGSTYYCAAFNAPVAGTTPPPDQTPTTSVTMCKLSDDAANTRLPGWTLMLKGAHVGDVSVNPDGAEYSLPNVPAGNYILTASGAYVYRAGDATASTSDAAFSVRTASELASGAPFAGPYAPWVLSNGFPAPNTGWLGLDLDNAFTDWGTVFHPDHVYATTTTLATAQDMNFSITDDQYADNSGSLDVSVDHGYEGVTGSDGCVTLDNVPYGQYTVSELNQPGWVPSTGTSGSGLGLISIGADSHIVIVRNHQVDGGGTVTPPATTYKVHIFKFLAPDTGDTDGKVPSTLGTPEQVSNDSTAPVFPMIATYAIAGVGTNMDPGDSYNLGDFGGVGGSDDSLKYAANTIPLAAGDTYGTHEVTDGTVTAPDERSCTVDSQYYLVGYKVGETKAAAASAPVTTTAPNFPSISSDEYVIVVNAACPQDDGGTPGQGTDTVSTTTVQAENLTTNPLTDLADWFFMNDANDGLDNNLGSFVDGPDTAPAGDGSAQISAAAGKGTILATLGYRGTKLANITTLGYSTYRSQGDPALELALQFEIDKDSTDADNSYQGRLVYEPYLRQTVTPNTWQTWNPMDSNPGWWFSNGVLAADSTCTQDTPCTWAQVMAKYPNASITGKTDFKAGTWSSDFTGNVDAFKIGVKDGLDTTTTTYDFEPTASSTTPPITTTSRSHSSHGSSGGSVPVVGQVLGAATTTEPTGTCGPILSSFLRIGRDNPTDQVTILQNFLNGELSMSLPVTGFFGPLTEKAVEAFQAKYFPVVLTPWVPHGLETDHSVTGYVYKTTLRQINMVACPSLDLPMPTLP